MDIDVLNTVEVFTTLRYINLHLLTYLLTVIATYSIDYPTPVPAEIPGVGCVPYGVDPFGSAKG